MHVQTFLHFDGCCKEAVHFYCSVLGGKVGDMMRFSDMPPGGTVGGGSTRPMPPAHHVMYSSFQIGDTTVMASDGCDKGVKPKGFSLTVTASDESEVNRIFAALSEGGTVITPLTQTFFSPRFGELTDRFGVRWMILLPSTAAK